MFVPDLAVQPDARPTNKLAVGMIVATLAQIGAMWLPMFFADPRVAETIALLTPVVSLLLGGGAGWLVHDRANVPMYR